MLTQSERHELFSLYDMGCSKEDAVLCLLLSRKFKYSFPTYWMEALQKCRRDIEAVMEFTRWQK